MNIQFNANTLFAPSWNNRAAAPAKTEKTEQEQAIDQFNKAREACDRTSDEMMDEHHKLVAESAKKMNEYYKQKMLREQAREAAQERQELNEKALVERVNYRSLLESQRLEAWGEKRDKEEDRLLG